MFAVKAASVAFIVKVLFILTRFKNLKYYHHISMIRSQWICNYLYLAVISGKHSYFSRYDNQFLHYYFIIINLFWAFQYFLANFEISYYLTQNNNLIFFYYLYLLLLL